MNKTFRRDGNQERVLTDEQVADCLYSMLQDGATTHITIAVPFIKDFGAKLILQALIDRSHITQSPLNIRILTRLDLRDLLHKASDLTAIRLLTTIAQNPNVKKGVVTVDVRVRDSLHAKVFLSEHFGIVGSANLTLSALKGGNDEISILSYDAQTIAQLRQHLNTLWQGSSSITLLRLDHIERQLNRLQRRFKDQLDEITREVRRSRIALQRFPSRTGEGVDYFVQMQAYLRWLQGRSGKPRRQGEVLEQLRTGNALNSQSPLPEQRLRFLRELNLVQPLANERVQLTEQGRKVAGDDNLQTKLEFLGMLIWWCESERGDLQLRLLLRAFQKPKARGGYLLAEWAQSIPLRAVEHWWGSREPDEFRENTCIARGWLSSLGILERSGNPAVFDATPLFSENLHDVDTWLNILTSTKIQ